MLCNASARIQSVSAMSINVNCVEFINRIDWVLNISKGVKRPGKRCSDTLRLGISQWILVGTCMGLNFFEVPRWVVILALLWYLHGWIFQQVHVWVVKNCTPWYMHGPDLIYRGTWMGHFSFKIGTWMSDGWWHFKIPRGTPLPRPELSTPPGARIWNWRSAPCNSSVKDYLWWVSWKSSREFGKFSMESLKLRLFVQIYTEVN